MPAHFVCSARLLVASLPLLAALAWVLAASPLPAQAPDPALSPTQKQQLEERSRYGEQARQLLQQGKPEEALAAAQKMLAIEKEVLGAGHADVAGSLQLIAQIHQRREDWEGARRAWRECLAVRSKLYGEGSWQAADARRGLADVAVLERLTPEQRRQLQQAEQDNVRAVPLYRHGQFARARPLLEQALQVYKELLGENHPSYADCLNNLATLNFEQGDHYRTPPQLERALQLRKQALGDEHPLYASSLNNLASAHRFLDDYERALPLLEQAVQVRKRALGEKHPDYTRSLTSLALLHQARARKAEGAEDWGRAQVCWRSALAVWSALHGPGDWRVAGARQALERSRRVQGLTAEQRQRLLQEENRDYPAAVDLSRRGDYETALPQLERALKVFKELLGEGHPSYADVLNSLANLHRDRGDYERALPLYERALKVYKEALGEGHPLYADSLNDLANLYRDQGDSDRALPLLERALQVYKDVLGEKLSWATSRANLAALPLELGDYAAGVYNLAMLRLELGDYAASLNNLAKLHQEMGHPDRALPLLEQALQVYKGDPRWGRSYAISLSNLASLYRDRGDYVRALGLLQGLGPRLAAQSGPLSADNLSNQAGLHRDQGDYQKALRLFEQALRLRQQVLGQGHPSYAAGLYNLALLSWARGDSKARLHAMQALERTRQLLDHDFASQSERQQLAASAVRRSYLDGYLSIMAPVAPATAGGQYRAVLAWKGAVFARQHRLHAARKDEHSTDPEIPRLHSRLQEVCRRLAALALAETTPPEQPRRHQLLQDLTEERERLERELAQQQQPSRAQLEGLTKERERLERELAQRSPAFRRQQQQTKLTAEQLQATLPDGVALVDFLEYTHSSPPPQRKGPFLTERRLLAFVVRPGRPVRRLDLGPAKPVEQAIGQWLATAGYTPARSRSAATDPGQQLRKLLWQPLEQHLQGVQTVLLSPDGVLARLPFAALPGKEGSYLLEEYRLAVLPVPQMLPDLLREDSRPAAPSSLLLVGEVDYDARPGAAPAELRNLLAAPARAGGLGRWAELAGTSDEADAIADCFLGRFEGGSLTELRKEEPTEAAVCRALQSHRYAHLATHGFFAPPELRSALAAASRLDRPLAGSLFTARDVSGFHPGLLSGVVLAGANRPGPDGQSGGILTALEVASLDLGGLELVSLSACETGLGESAGGEGLLGLQRAFQVAGARSAVASLWKVPDQATRVLMERFYENLWDKKLGKLEALRQAQLWLLREASQDARLVRGLAEEVRRSRESERGGRGLGEEQEPREGRPLPPYFWAAFVLSGDWR